MKPGAERAPCGSAKGRSPREWPHGDRFWCGRPVPQCAVWPNLVVFPPPTLDQDPRFLQRVEQLSVQKLIAELPVEALHIAALVDLGEARQQDGDALLPKARKP